MIEVHIDADDAEVYAKVDFHDKYLRESFIVEALTNALALLNESNVKAVVFIVAKNLEKNIPYQDLLQQFIKDGHAIGNHSYSHAEDFHRWAKEEQVQDIQLADKVIRERLGYNPRFFRGPGYSSSHAIQKSLLQMGYVYDCTKIPLLYSSALDFYFKINKNGNKSIPSFIRVRDLYFSLAKPIIGIEELKIHPNKVWGIPNYSTWMFQHIDKEQYFSELIRKTQRPFLFHAVDFLDYSNNRSKVPALRIQSEDRFQIIRKILLQINCRQT
jgi:peptidoglycan/xylan/chitin deacetylase (PgdA/CDA1 family)